MLEYIRCASPIHQQSIACVQYANGHQGSKDYLVVHMGLLQVHVLHLGYCWRHHSLYCGTLPLYTIR